MKIELSRKEYRTLLEMVEIGHHVITAYPREPEDELPDAKPYDEMEQKLLEMAEEFGCAHLVESEKTEDMRYPTQAFEELYMQFVDLFSEDTFWDELMSRLVEREILRRYGPDALDTLSDEELEKADEESSRYYADELQEHGIERLEIVENAPIPERPKPGKGPKNGRNSKREPKKKKSGDG